MRRDLQHSWRMLRKSPAFAITAVLTLALGISGNTAIFTIIRAVLLKPLEYHEPGRLVYFSADNPRQNAKDIPFTLIRLERMRATVRSFSEFGAVGPPEDMSLSATGEPQAQPEALKGTRVSANFLTVLGVHPMLGRSFLPDEDTPGGRPVAMISAELWRRRFGGDPNIAGKTVTLDSTAYTIIGVLSPGFEFPRAGIDVWVTKPSEWSKLAPRYWRTVTLLTGFARLKPTVSLEQAQAEMDVLNQQYLAAHPDFGAEPGVTMRMVWLKDRLVANVRQMLWMLFGAVGFVLMIACANVASLLMARATSRTREFAVRAALGAGRGRLIRQLLAESLMLAAAGGALGVLVAKWVLSAITTISAVSLPRSGEIQIDSPVLGFTLLLSIATGILFGLVPSLQVSRPDLAVVLREAGAGRGSSGKPGVIGVSPRDLLVVGQVALSIVLLLGAALLIESFARLHSVDPGFQPANLLTMKVALPPARYDADQKRAVFFEELVQRVETLPGVRGATMAMSLPTTIWTWTDVHVEGQPEADPNQPSSSSEIQSVTPDYFRTLGIRLLRGREFAARDDTRGAPPVMIINESLARLLWPSYPAGKDPVGQHIREGYDKAAGWMEIVGIVADVHEGGLAFKLTPEFYVPCAVHPPQNAYLAVRTAGDPMRLANAVRMQVLEIDRDQPVSNLKTMDDVIAASVGQRRLTMLLLGSFAAVALLLAIVGIYGVVAYSVTKRTQELGIRRALGAQRGDILRLVLSQGLGLALAGVAVGVSGSLALTRLMTGLLFHVSATDPATFACIALLFVGVALAASYIPARRATRIDPMAALR